MAKRKVADIVVQALEEAGAEHCYGVGGDTLNHVTDADPAQRYHRLGARPA